MSQPSEHELYRLGQAADELREVFAERGYRVDIAMDVDPAFGSGTSRAWVTRDLVMSAVGEAAGRIGLDFRPVNGNGREIRCLSNGIDRRYRVRRAQRRTDNSLRITASQDSALAATAEPSLFRDESWAFAWTLDADTGLIDEVLAAEVTGYEAGRPGYLILDRIIPLGGNDLPTGGFRPRDEDLNFGYDEDDEDFGGEFGSAS